MPSDIFAKRRQPVSALTMQDLVQAAAMAAPPYAPMAEAAPGVAARAVRAGEIAPAAPGDDPEAEAAAAMTRGRMPYGEIPQYLAQFGMLGPGPMLSESARRDTAMLAPYAKKYVLDPLNRHGFDIVNMATGGMAAPASEALIQRKIAEGKRGEGVFYNREKRTVARPPDAAPMDPILEFWQQMQRDNAGPMTGR